MLELFSTNHFIWLGATAVLVAALFALSLLFRKRMNALLTVGFVILLALELVKMSYNAFYSDEPSAPWQKGFYVQQYILPFHLCTIQTVLLLIARCSKPESSARKLLLPVISVCSVLGGIMAVVIPVEGVAFTADTVLKTIMPYRYFTTHAVLIALGLAIAFHPETGWTGKSYFKTIGCLFLLFVASLYLNSMFHTNFMYTAYPPAENLPFLEVTEGDLMSWLLYLVKLVLCTLLLVTLFYVPIWITLGVQKGKKARETNAFKTVPVLQEETPVEAEPVLPEEKEEAEEEYDEEYDEAPITIASILEGEYTEEEKQFIESGVLPESNSLCPVEELSEEEPVEAGEPEFEMPETEEAPTEGAFAESEEEEIQQDVSKQDQEE